VSPTTTSTQAGLRRPRTTYLLVAILAAALGALAALGLQRLGGDRSGDTFTGVVATSRWDGSVLCVQPDGGGDARCGLPVAVTADGEPLRGKQIQLGARVGVEVRPAASAQGDILVVHVRG
jgi:hypothetical protein